MYEKLAEALAERGDLQFEPDYVGRGMTKPVAALIGSHQNMFEAIHLLVTDLMDDALACDTKDCKKRAREEYENLRFESIESLRIDTMGSDLIFY